MNQLTPAVERIQIFKWAGLGLILLGLFIGLWVAVSDEQGPLRTYWQSYVVFLERKLRLLFIWTPGSVIATGQIVAMFIVLLLAALVGLPYWYMFVVVIAIVPAIYIEQLRMKRVVAIEQQLDGFIMTLANALKATPSLGDAFQSIQKLVPAPLQQEIELAVKEMRVGSTLEQALLLMAGRIGSRQVDSALSAVLIGRQIGGNLPKILDTTASTLREMARLEGVVRTKTAEGKMQMWVLALAPLVLMLLFTLVKSDYFDPLTESITGYMVIIAGVGFWIASLVTARKILSVDL